MSGKVGSGSQPKMFNVKISATDDERSSFSSTPLSGRFSTYIFVDYIQNTR